MAGLRVFVSSTCYDLSAVRAHLRLFIQSLGHEPVMSDFNDVLYDPRVHTHSSCVDEVGGCDVVVLLIGARYGGKSVPEALLRVDFDSLAGESKSVESLKAKENVSVTQLEVLKAVEEQVPVFTFIDNRVWHDHALYEKNKEKAILPEIAFPSIERPETVRFIFEFINFLRHRVRNNSVHPFGKIQDIEEALRRQWSGLFQRLLQEQRAQTAELRRIDTLAEQFEDLKTAILTSIDSSDKREVARGVVRFRRLADFLRGMGLQDSQLILKEAPNWDEFLERAGIKAIIDASELPFSDIRARGTVLGGRRRSFLVKDDDTFYELRFPKDFLSKIKLDLEAFVRLAPGSREVILDALSEMFVGPTMVRYSGKRFGEFLMEEVTDTIGDSEVDEDS